MTWQLIFKIKKFSKLDALRFNRNIFDRFEFEDSTGLAFTEILINILKH